MTKIPEDWADKFLAATDAVDNHSRTWSATSSAALSLTNEDYYKMMDLWEEEHKKLLAKQEEVAAIAAKITGKTIDETICGALAGYLLASLAKQGIYPSDEKEQPRS